jgi:dynein heavy chain
MVEGRQDRLERMLGLLEQCEKALQDYLETKRIAFPRFYFVSPMDLLDILAKGTNPQLILKHLAKCFDNIHNLKFTLDDEAKPTKEAIGMFSGEGEYVAFDKPCSCDGSVEVWMQRLVDHMRSGLKAEFCTALPLYDEKPRAKWIFDQSVQNTVVITRVAYTQEVNAAFDAMEEGNENAMKDVLAKQIAQLASLIELINGELSKNDRKKIVTLCTIDVHARDVAQKLIDRRIESGTAFEWSSQLRYSQNEKTLDAQVNICDVEIAYMYEYIGNCGTLVITPLTDRCYITLTQAQRLVLGGAPAGPAGTGKTETVKDLGRALGCQVYVFNCSDQMDYQAMGQTYKGLAQTGAWGCFDEFNRIPVAVLSVCSTQYKTVLDAIRAKRQRFIFEGVDISLRTSAMAFITMNPGYAGRAELPESLKALFRPVSMCIPDLALICEIMLMAEGFLQSKLLARKFVILYKLCEDLLSKAPHYDWKLRAIKTTLYVAGGMKRAQPELSEDKVLLQALRDFNLGKLTSDDHGIFMGLLNDLFPRTVDSVPRRVDKAFEAQIQQAAQELGYQPEDLFCLKITQLREIFEVRWSVFLLGPAGCGKSAVWRTLQRAQNNYGERTQSKPINPKSVTRNELYGFVHPATREWREGLISVTYRDMANNSNFQHQWIVLDGDIDAEWIESMNTVMDDNKMLTLASNERIPLTNSMRLLLEINHMIHCSPATVSRGGVIYLNAEDIGWSPVVESWIQGRDDKSIAPLLSELFGRYLEKSLEHCRRNFRTVVPLVAVNIAQTVCKILEGMLPDEPVRGGSLDKKLLEAQFSFACVWALGGCMLVDKVVDFRTQFSKWWTTEWKAVFWPERGTVFDYYVDPKSGAMQPWEDRVSAFAYAPNNFSSLFVPTVETTRLSFLLDSLVARGHYVMFVGNAGTVRARLPTRKRAKHLTLIPAARFASAGQDCADARQAAPHGPGDDVVRDAQLQQLHGRVGAAGHPGAASGEAQRRALRPGGRQAPHLLHRRHEHAVRGQVRHAVAHRAGAPVCGLPRLVRQDQDCAQGGAGLRLRGVHEPHGRQLQHHAAHAAPLCHVCGADAVVGDCALHLHGHGGRPPQLALLSRRGQAERQAGGRDGGAAPHGEQLLPHVGGQVPLPVQPARPVGRGAGPVPHAARVPQQARRRGAAVGARVRARVPGPHDQCDGHGPVPGDAQDGGQEVLRRLGAHGRCREAAQRAHVVHEVHA